MPASRRRSKADACLPTALSAFIARWPWGCTSTPASAARFPPPRCASTCSQGAQEGAPRAGKGARRAHSLLKDPAKIAEVSADVPRLHTDLRARYRLTANDSAAARAGAVAKGARGAGVEEAEEASRSKRKTKMRRTRKPAAASHGGVMHALHKGETAATWRTRARSPERMSSSLAPRARGVAGRWARGRRSQRLPGLQGSARLQGSAQKKRPSTTSWRSSPGRSAAGYADPGYTAQVNQFVGPSSHCHAIRLRTSANASCSFVLIADARADQAIASCGKAATSPCKRAASGSSQVAPSLA